MSVKKNVFILDDAIREKKHVIDIHQEYTHIRGYHGCRPVCVNDYYKFGIKPIERDSALKEAVFRLCGEFVTEKEVIDEFEKMWSKLHVARDSVWLAFSESEILNYCGHYVIYGSEFICGIAVQLSCRDSLTEIGIPTIFICDLPLENIPKCYLSNIQKMILEGNRGGGFRIDGRVRPEEIVGVSHPDIIDDPLTNMVYRYQ